MAGPVLCEYDDCDDVATFTFGVGRGQYVPTRDALCLCGDHALHLRRLMDEEDGPGQLTFLDRCRLIPTMPTE